MLLKRAWKPVNTDNLALASVIDDFWPRNSQRGFSKKDCKWQTFAQAVIEITHNSDSISFIVPQSSTDYANPLTRGEHFASLVKRFSLSAVAISKTQEALEKLGIIDVHKGSYFTRSTTTWRMRPYYTWNPRILNCLPPHIYVLPRNARLAKPFDGLAQWSGEKGTSRPTRYIDHDMQRQLKQHHASIEVIDERYRPVFYSYLICAKHDDVFCEEPTGRLTSRFCAWSKKDRQSFLEFAGLRNYVEVDFRAMVPSIISKINGIDTTEDPYFEIIDSLGLDLSDDERILSRKAMKLIVLIAIGSRSIAEAVHVPAAFDAYANSPLLKKTCLQNIYAAISKNPRYAGFAFAGKISSVFKIESRIMLRALELYHDAHPESVAIPLYDAIYGPCDDQDEIRDILDSAFMEVTL